MIIIIVIYIVIVMLYYINYNYFIGKFLLFFNRKLITLIKRFAVLCFIHINKKSVIVTKPITLLNY